jgi:hypothetical protein
MKWNGLALVNGLSAELGDTSTAFKVMVLGYINDGLRDISSKFQWPQMRRKGKAILSADTDTHNLLLPKPSAPSVALAAGGSLTEDVEYKFLVTFYEGEAQVESRAGTASAGVSPTTGNQKVDLSGIPVSESSLVTARKVYLSKGGGAYFYHSTIEDNTTTTTTISTDPTGQITAPTEGYIETLDGDLFIENSRNLEGLSFQDYQTKVGPLNSSGTPAAWTPIDNEKVLIYPKPTEDIEVSFWYFARPAEVFGTTSSIPQLPSFLLDDLRRYVKWRGMDYRDRDGKESAEITYRDNLKETFSKKGKLVKKSYRVRSTIPDSDGRIR